MNDLSHHSRSGHGILSNQPQGNLSALFSNDGSPGSEVEVVEKAGTIVLTR